MGERRHKAENGERKAIQSHREEERRLEKTAPEALKHFSVNIAKPADIQSLQRVVGNRVVTNMIQRHSHETRRRYGFRAVDLSTGRPVTIIGVE